MVQKETATVSHSFPMVPSFHGYWMVQPYYITIYHCSNRCVAVAMLRLRGDLVTDQGEGARGGELMVGRER